MTDYGLGTEPHGGRSLTRFRWERRLCGENGPNATARLVGLVLATHVNRALEAWPTITLLATETGLTERAVGSNLRALESAGWISRALRGDGKNWRNYVYQLTLPALAEERRSAPSAPLAEERRSVPSAPMVGNETPVGEEPRSIGAELDAPLVRNDVPTNTSKNITYNIPRNKGARSAPDDASPGDSIDNDEEVIAMNGNDPQDSQEPKADADPDQLPTSDAGWDEFLKIQHVPGEHPNSRACRTAARRHAYLKSRGLT